MSKLTSRLALAATAMAFAGLTTSQLMAHGDVTPQAVDTSALPDIGEEWLDENPYSGNEKAIEIGASAYNQNCARCHGLEGISGGIAPDLRYLELGPTGDEWYIERYRNGSSHDGKVYMPPFGEVLGQKAGWAIRSWVETKYTDDY
ncbi:cytochrome c-550 PedF [Croceicoccus gelatinilyticus]|uniref:cytochrome c-550 PedF n=1 Tax=Croceicoccus gelatinilyticus TaxID=2835536 RepID=UPI001BCD6425|nr:cytochrome c-550 PedF [Croceicoccus gelatinilyticus]